MERNNYGCSAVVTIALVIRFAFRATLGAAGGESRRGGGGAGVARLAGRRRRSAASSADVSQPVAAERSVPAQRPASLSEEDRTSPGRIWRGRVGRRHPAAAAGLRYPREPGSVRGQTGATRTALSATAGQRRRCDASVAIEKFRINFA